MSHDPGTATTPQVKGQCGQCPSWPPLPGDSMSNSTVKVVVFHFFLYHGFIGSLQWTLGDQGTLWLAHLATWHGNASRMHPPCTRGPPWPPVGCSWRWRHRERHILSALGCPAEAPTLRQRTVGRLSRAAHLCYTHLLLHSIRLESNSVGSSYLADTSKPVPWLLVHRQQIGRLVDPFMRVNNRLTTHLATLRES